ncbi:hypothetical protein HWV62_43184 [Athelia sp. TMB]|nr:hypothetical protein HWV62_43184 [Athelia sp. TMB]
MSLTPNSSAAPSPALQPSDTSRSSSPFDLIAPETPAQGDERGATEKHPFYYFGDGNLILSVRLIYSFGGYAIDMLTSRWMGQIVET